MMWKIGDVRIKNQIVLAPMAGICDCSFRTLIKSMGCGLIGTEMVSSKAIMYDNPKAQEMLFMKECERPISQQIFGSDVESMIIASLFIEENMKPDIIDINMGCPVPKVTVRSQSGCTLLKNPDKAYEIVESVVDAVSIPVTVKIRSGWDFNSVNAVEIAGLLEDAGASAVTVHPRTKSQGYSGEADWSVIKSVKDAISIPVIGNGDVKSCFDVEAMLMQTGCDAVMIGRGVFGNPWLIKECVEYLDSGVIPKEVSIYERISMLKRHAELLIENKGESVAMFKIRRHAAYYVRSLPNVFGIRQKIFQMKTKNELFDLLDEYLKFLEK